MLMLNPQYSAALLENEQPLPPIIALIGSDGSGKSTLSADLTRILGHERPVMSCYLGLGSGDLGRRIGQLPLIGQYLERVLTKRAKTTRSPGEKIPGPLTALVVYGFSILRYLRFRRMQRARQQGYTIVTDRFPQVEIPGMCDGPGLSVARPGNRFVAALARRERALYEKMAEVWPSLVIRLDIDPETAHSRKPDHDLGLLKAKAETITRLRFGAAPIISVDARKSYNEVLKRVVDLCKKKLT
ncbi:hypothetical protein [Acetobacter sp.]|uniref:hypothetical protein n=1 Tax=Acetobacter sp. TaxID=440 RepID=UPI0039E7D27B